MNKEEFYSIGRGSLNLNGKFYYGLDYAITDFMRNMEQLNQQLNQQLKEKNKIIDEILSYGWFDEDCPTSITGEELEYCENCMDNFKQCWLEFFENKVKEGDK